MVPCLGRFEDDFEAQLGNPREVEHSCMGLGEDTEQGGSEDTENRLGQAEDDPEARIVEEIR